MPKNLNNTQFAESDLLLFNRVPKVGSEHMIELIRRLSVLNGFETNRAYFSEPVRQRLTPEEQEELAKELDDDYGEPFAYSMHVNYIDFRAFNLPQPIYINMIRDPIERVISWFYYKRAPWTAVQMYKLTKKFRKPQWYKKSFEECVLHRDIECRYETDSSFGNSSEDHKRQTLFFCGHDPGCEPFNSQSALQLAKKHVENEYAVVGSWEDLNVTLELYTLSPWMLNNTAKAEIDIIFFNRLEKVGSQSMSQLLRTLSRIHKFTYNIKVRNVGQILDTSEEQRDLAEEILDYGIPNAFTMHRNFINFTDLDLPKPIYINLVRHPIEKVKSAYYYLRHPFIYNNMLLRNPSKPTKKYEFFNISFNDCVREGKIPDCIFEPHTQFNSDWRRFAMHFCGNQPVCKQFNSQTATQIAKRNIETEYAVVGSWEDTNITLTVLENYIPRFFRGATRVYYSDPKRFHKNATPHKNELDPDIEAQLKVQFSFEIELYNFCKQRLYKQYIAIRKDEVIAQFN
ncbi:heparan sulfate 2-O-sulfotransferase pipe-like [Rhagoletis pomonella]|uniref:heparan sulfate 2-O-sulfotransferase pipe-like n=1 Tax=Rhagoletis pomonella TaxID=28610 RepID=UPI0017802FD5|nr:heparan sulfate 2-O-sulfotransferase pipe-like [Rhagoletis pomonella]